jgi:N-acetyl-anhydromuramyl-L-alanine amidase AmpD
VAQLVEHVPSLRYVTRHSDIDPRKTDPGPGFRWAWLDELGLEVVS